MFLINFAKLIPNWVVKIFAKAGLSSNELKAYDLDYQNYQIITSISLRLPKLLRSTKNLHLFLSFLFFILFSFLICFSFILQYTPHKICQNTGQRKPVFPYYAMISSVSPQTPPPLVFLPQTM